MSAAIRRSSTASTAARNAFGSPDRGNRDRSGVPEAMREDALYSAANICAQDACDQDASDHDACDHDASDHDAAFQAGSIDATAAQPAASKLLNPVAGSIATKRLRPALGLASPLAEIAAGMLTMPTPRAP